MAQDLFSQLALQTLSEISAADSPAAGGDDPVLAIIQVAQERGLDPTHLLGLAKLETQAGRKTIKGNGTDTRNLFNVKDFSREGNGIRALDKAEGSNDRYRTYGSYRESVEDLAGLLERRYPGAAKADSPEAFARELKRGGYATDPAYERKLASTIRSSAARSPERPQEWDQGARYAPVGLAPRSVEDSKPAEKPSKSAGFLEGTADVGLSAAQGVVGSVKALTDLAGADNTASRGLDDASKGLEKLKSDASQADRQYHQQKIKEAEASGDWKDEVAAYANMVWDMPLESLAQGVGSFATLGAGKVAQMAKLANAAKKAGVAKEAFLKTAQGIEAAKKASDLGMKVNVGLGVGQGIGGVKGSQYEQTFNAAKESGLSDQQAQAMATEAQSYQQGWGQQALGAGLGYMAGKTGPIEKLATGKTVGAGGVARRFVGGGLIEAGTEGLQGGQERYAGNAAAIDAGVLDPSMQWAGVAGSGASEAITAGVLGGGAGALGRPDVDPQAQAKAAAQKSGGIASRASLAATTGAQQQAAAAPTQPAAQQAAAAGATAQPAASQAAGSTAPAQPAQTAIQASAMSAIEQALEADKQRRRTAGEVVEDDVTEGDVVAAGDPPAAVLPDPPGAQASTPAQPATSAGFSLPVFDNSPLPKTDPAAAEEQRRQAAELEQKRKNRRAGTRAAVWERNPMLAFLGANGISRDAAGEFAPGLIERRKAFVPGYGPVFRPGAKNLDELVQNAKEDGFLREDDGEPELYDLIDRALRGERIAPLYADGAAEAEGQRRLQAMQERDGADFEDYLAQAEDFDPFPLMDDSGYDEQDLAEIGRADVAVQNEVAALQQQYADLGFDPADVLESLAAQTENLSDQAYYDLAKSRFIQLLDQAYGQAEPQAEQGSDRAVRQPDGQEGDAQEDGSAAGGQAAGPVTPPAAPVAASPKRADAIRAKLDSLRGQGFSQFTRSGGRTLLLNPDTYETVELTPAEMAVAKAAAGQTRASLQSLRGQRRPAQVNQQGADVLQSYTPADVLAQDEQAQSAQAQQIAEQQAAADQAKANDERKRIEQASYAAADSFELGQNPLDSLTGQQDIFSAAKPVAQDLAGERINDEWTAFDPQSGTLGIPRAEMPQIKAEHRGAMMGFLKARGIDGQQETIPAAAIKPTQAEFSPAKVKKAMDRQGGNRSIIVSADGYVVDGHHQWLAAREKGEPIQAIRLDQNIGDVLAALKDMPSAQPEQAAQTEPVKESDPYPLVEHITAKGKVLRGYIVRGMTLDEVKDSIDPYALKKDDGVFVREKHKDKLPKPAASELSSGRAAAGGQVGVNGYFYKGGQFLPTTMAEPGKWKLDGKWVTSGREEVEPREWGHAPTPFSRSIYAMINAWTDLKDGKLSVRDGIRDYQGNPVTPDTEIRPGVRGVQGQQALTLQELIDAWNAGQRWFDVQPNAKTITTQEQTAAEPVQQDSQAAAGKQGIITADDVAAAEKQVAQMIEARIDAMKAPEVQRIAARFLPTVGVKVPMGKAKIKAAMTDATAMNLLGPAGELRIELSESVKRALVAKMEGRVGVSDTNQALDLDAQLAQVNAELATQGMVQNANTRSKRDQLRKAIAERDFPEIFQAVDGDVSTAEDLHQAFQVSGNEPKAQTIERVLKRRGITEEYRKRWAERLLAGAKPAGREGYDTPVALDAAQLKAILEQTRGEPLVDKPAKLEAWRNGTAKTDPAKFPIELVLRPDGKLDVNDGRHRIALAAERGEKVTAFIDGKDAQRVQDLLSAASNSAGPKQDADFQERLERANSRVPEGFEIRAEGNTVSLYFNGERTQYYGLNGNDGGISEAVRQANRLFNESASSSQAIQDFIDGKRDMTPTLEEVQAEQAASPAAANADLEAIFDQLDGLTQRTQANGQRAAAAHPQAEQIQFVQKHILDILQDLEDSGKVTINC